MGSHNSAIFIHYQTHRAGKTHGNAEALSRRPQFPTAAAIKTVNNNGFQANCIRNLQHQGVNLADLIAYLKSDELPANNKLASSLLLIVDDFFSEDDITGRKETSPFVQLVVPDGLKLQIINLFMVFSPSSMRAIHLETHSNYMKNAVKLFS